MYMQRIKEDSCCIIIVLCFCFSHISYAQIIYNNILYSNLPHHGLICKGFADSTQTYNRLILPDSILVNGENKAVYAIGGFAFFGRKDLQYVRLPKSLHRIYTRAFANCENLDSVYIPDSLWEVSPDVFDESNLVNITISPQNPYFDSRDNSCAIIDSRNNELLTGSANTIIPVSISKLGEKAFSKRKKLKQIIIPQNITKIGSQCFDSCDSLTSVTFEENKSKTEGNRLCIGYYAFRNCKGLTSIQLPNRLDSIESAAFWMCKNLESIYIPENVSYISMAQFGFCSNLKSVIIAQDNKYYDSRNNCNAIIETNTNTLISACSTTVIPNSVNTIGTCAFSKVNIDSIFIPSSVKEIGNEAFNSKGIHSVSIPESIKVIDLYSFLGCSNLKKIYLSHLNPPVIEDCRMDLTPNEFKDILKDYDEDNGYAFLRNLCVYVPKIAYKKFEKHPIWKQLRIVSY